MVHRRDPRAPCVCQRAAERPPGTWHREWATNPPEAAPEGSPTVAPSRSGSPFEVRVRLRGPGPEPSPGRLRAAGCPKDKYEIEVGAVKILEGMASRFTGQRVCCSCVLIRSENLLRTDGPTTHARGPRPGPDPASDAAHVLIHVGHCEAGRTHTPLQVTREPRDLGGPYSRPAPLQSALISHPTRRGRSRRRSPWLVLHRSCGTQPQCLEVVWCTGVNVNAT